MRLLISFLETKRFGSEEAVGPCGQAGSAKSPRARSKYVPARLRRAVFDREGGRCTYVDERGVRGESCVESAPLLSRWCANFASHAPKSTPEAAVAIAPFISAMSGAATYHISSRRWKRASGPIIVTTYLGA
jgi:hypothetical protein